MFLNLGLGRMGCLPGILTAGAALTLAFSSGTFPREVTHSRSTSATQVYSDGLVDFAPENLLLYSSTISNGAWTGSNRSISDDTTANPPDTLAGSTADTIVEDTTVSAFHWIAQNVTKPAAAQTYQFTGYCHSSSTRDIAVYLQSGANGCNTRIRPSTGVITGPAATFGSGWSAVSSTIVSVGGGWYRFTLQATSDTTTTVTSQIALYNAAFSYTGNGTSGATVWGLRLQRGTHSRAEDDFLLQTTSAAVYGPRTQYDPVTLACLGYLNEPQRTNLLLRSQEFDNASWAKGDATVTADATTAPDGTSTADKIVETATTAAHQVYQTVTRPSGAWPAAFSCYAKAAERNYLMLEMSDGVGGAYVTFDIQAGTVATTAATYGAGISIVSQSITSVGNGWYRVALCAATTNAAVVMTQILRIGNVANLGGGSVGTAGNGAYLWGVQLEAASTASSYIPTAGASATRAADVAYVDVATWLPALSMTNSTFYAEFIAAEPGDYQRILGSSQVSVSILESGPGTFISSWDGTSVASVSGPSYVGITRRAATAFSPGGRTLAYAGVTGTAASNGFTAPARIYLGCGNDGAADFFSGTFLNARVYYGAQSAGQIAALTT